MDTIKPFNDIIVRVPQAYTDKLVLPSGFVLHLNTIIRESYDSVRYGEVVAVPDNCIIDVEVGDILFFHQNITSIVKMEHGDIDSDYLYEKKQNLYRVPINPDWPLIYARDRRGSFKTLDGICFIRPKIENKYNTSLVIADNEQEVTHIGEIAHISDTLAAQGYKVGQVS